MYTSQAINLERSIDVHEAVETRDSEALYRLSRLEKKEGNDEFADALYKLAKRIDREDNAFDEWRDNQN